MSSLSNPSLFTTFAERAMQRLDEVVMNRDCPWPISVDQYELLKLLRTHQGAAKAIALGEVCERLKLTPRQVKDLVQDLRLNFRVQIGASRDSGGGRLLHRRHGRGGGGIDSSDVVAGHHHAEGLPCVARPAMLRPGTRRPGPHATGKSRAGDQVKEAAQ